MTDNRIENLLSALGYKDNVQYYFPLIDFAKNSDLSYLSRIFNRINLANENVEVIGSYVVRTNIDENTENTEKLCPVVFVAKAETVNDARQLHQDLWNSSSVPFVIVILPSEIRVYTGFDYDRKNEANGLIETITTIQTDLFGDLSDLVIEALQKYSADAINNGSIWKRLQESPNFNYDNRVDKRLLLNLEQLEQALLDKLKNKIEKEKALQHIHAIIGKYVYFRYLKDREILTDVWAKNQNIDLNKVFQFGATLNELKRLSNAIEGRFEGYIFPFPEGFENIFDDELVSDVASVFFGDTVRNQPALFDVYDFSYIPVETLSYIYEQFLKSQGVTKKDGAVYTPEALADYLINEISLVKPLRSGMKILDPCCGSGIFLVLTYRYLIELEIFECKSNHLAPNKLKQIMEESIHGVEMNLEACYVTEFSLILILLNYIDPPDLAQNEDFKFPNLHNKNIFEGDFFDPSKTFYPLTMNFEWIIGNPPWKAVNIEENPKDANALEWINSNSDIYPVGRNRIEEAFAWRATEFVSNDGYVGFILPAKRLFNGTSEDFRKEFFKKNEVVRITNFSNFHYLLFQADVSAITIVYQKAVSGRNKRLIWHYSPFVANQIMSQLKKGKPTRPVWSIVINKSETRSIDSTEAENGDAITWKMAFWGSYEDERTFTRLCNSFSQTLGHLIKKQHWELHEGLRLRVKGENTEGLDDTLFEKFGYDLKYFDGGDFVKNNYRFHIPDGFLKIIPKENRYIPKGAKGALSLIPAPHLVLNAQYAVYSDEDFVIKNLYGLSSAKIEDASHLKAISVFFNSTICHYLLFFLSPQWGIDVTKLDKTDWQNLPVPSFSKKQIKDLSNLQNFLSEEEKKGENDKVLQKILDETIEKTLKIPSSTKLLVHDFFDVKLTLNKKKNLKKVTAVNFVSSSDLKKYATRLRNTLDEFAEGGGEKHSISITYSQDLIICQISIFKTDQTQEIRLENADDKSKLKKLKDALQEPITQWIYIQREITYFDANAENFYICKSSRLIDWVESRAITDANTFIAEVLANSKFNLDKNSQTQSYERKNPFRINKN